MRLLLRSAHPIAPALALAMALAWLELFILLPTAYAQARLKVMPLGDSITAGDRNGGYRRLLDELLIQDGISFEFVGSLTGGDIPDAHHEGHSGWRIDQIEDGIAGGWLQTKPDVVLLRIGTNDIWQHKGANAPARLSALIDAILSRSSSARIIVAQILPMTNDATFEAEVMKYNAAIPDIVTSKAPVVCMVNMHDSFSASDFVDGVHPNNNGYDKMARIWEPAIRAVIDGVNLVKEGYHCGRALSAFPAGTNG